MGFWGNSWDKDIEQMFEKCHDVKLDKYRVRGKGMRHFMIPEFFEHMQLHGNHTYYWNLSDIKHDAQNEGYLDKIQYLLDADARHPDYGNVYVPSVFIA